jgi:oxygen-independent coproporphyrinogen-3 oxidase
MGLGPSAHSHWEGVRWANIDRWDAYVTKVEAGVRPIEYTERLEGEAKARETLVMALRRRDGVDRQWFKSVTGYDYRELAGPVLDTLKNEGWVEDLGYALRLSDKALFVSNAVFSQLI